MKKKKVQILLSVWGDDEIASETMIIMMIGEM